MQRRPRQRDGSRANGFQPMALAIAPQSRVQLRQRTSRLEARHRWSALLLWPRPFRLFVPTHSPDLPTMGAAPASEKRDGGPTASAATAICGTSDLAFAAGQARDRAAVRGHPRFRRHRRLVARIEEYLGIVAELEEAAPRSRCRCVSHGSRRQSKPAAIALMARWGHRFG